MNARDLILKGARFLLFPKEHRDFRVAGGAAFELVIYSLKYGPRW